MLEVRFCNTAMLPLSLFTRLDMYPSLELLYNCSPQLPYICPYQTGHYHVLLYGLEVRAPIVEETEYTTTDTVNPLTIDMDSTALEVNNTYTVVVFVSNSGGTTNASITFGQ